MYILSELEFPNSSATPPKKQIPVQFLQPKLYFRKKSQFRRLTIDGVFHFHALIQIICCQKEWRKQFQSYNNEERFP